MRSMTAFGSATVDTGSCRVAVRLRSVNHRFLDVVVRLPDDLRHLEVDLRQRLSSRLARGRIDLRVDVDDRREIPAEVVVSRPWIEALRAAADSLAAEGLTVGDIQVGDLLQAPEAVRVVSGSRTEDTEIGGLIESAVDQALDRLVAGRDREGEELATALSRLLTGLGREIEAIAGQQEQVRAELQERLLSRLGELAASGAAIPDETRVAQEIALLIDRSDVREELDRLQAHLANLEAGMRASEPIGKKLDFVVQEIARELNTLGVKCRATRLADRVLEAKLVCEQIREQVQNIE